MSTNKTPAKTPAQTAKPFGGTSKPAASKETKAAPSAAASVAGDDPSKAVEKLETKTKAVNSNNISRVANSQLTSNDDKLNPLVSIKNGQPIEKFPSTSKDIEKLSLTQVDAILNALEADRAGNEAKKKEKLRVQIGLKPTPA